MDDVQKITSQLEHIFLDKLLEGLRQRTLTIPQAKELANNFLKNEPFTSFEEAVEKMKAFTREHAELGVLNDYLSAFHQERQKGALIEKMRMHLKKGEIDQAIQVAKSK
jgi:hypothetical protein